MTKLASTARWIVLLAAGSTAACGSGDPGSSGVTVTPPQATLPIAAQQLFAASSPTVNWSVREGPGGGTISATGLYTAPGSAGTYTVVAVDPASGATGEARVTVRPANGVVTHGLTIPGTHPRLWFDAARLATAQAWYPSHPFTPNASSESQQNLERATRALLNATNPVDQQTMARAAIDWALARTAFIASEVSPGGGTGGWDEARWDGEALITIYDWCHPFMTPAERTAFIANTNAWIEGMRTEPYGGPAMFQNNYFWGRVRNEILWAIASYEDNIAAAEVFLDDALVTRLELSFDPGSRTSARGGVCEEGSQYGNYLTGYSTIPYVTAGLLGRDLHSETSFWIEAVYALVYATTPGPRAGEAAHYYFPHNDSQSGLAGSSVLAGYDYPNFMTAAAMRWAGSPVGQHARRWLDVTGAQRSQHVRSVDPGGTAIPFTDLPLDYYAAGPRYLFARTDWTADATAIFLQMGDRDAEHVGHTQSDWGSWQLWRKGRFLSRETPVYGDTPGHRVVGYANGPVISGALGIGHNTLLVDGTEAATFPVVNGLVTVPRLESRPGYAFAVADLTPLTNDARYGNPAFVSWVREHVFVRGLETLVILDRVQSSTAGATKTFLAHSETSPAVGTGTATITNGDQQLVMRTLLPASSTYRVVTEGGSVGQYRIEVDTTPGTAQSYVLTVLQAKDAAAPALAPSLSETATSYTVVLDGSNRVTFEKGMASAGGSITVAGATAPLGSGVQPMSVGVSGPAWQ